MNLPGYDIWKLQSPDEMTPAEEREQEVAYDEARDNLREAIAATLHDERGKVYLADIRQIVIEELNKLQPQPGEPAWQTKTPVPIPAMG